MEAISEAFKNAILKYGLIIIGITLVGGILKILLNKLEDKLVTAGKKKVEEKRKKKNNASH